jgi:hypothetical protein
MLVPSPDAAIEPDGPRWVLRTAWAVDRQPPPGASIQFELSLDNGERSRVWDLASVWWYPPERWLPGEVISINVPGVPVRRFRSWRPVLSGFYDD